MIINFNIDLGGLLLEIMAQTVFCLISLIITYTWLLSGTSQFLHISCDRYVSSVYIFFFYKIQNIRCRGESYTYIALTRL